MDLLPEVEAVAFRIEEGGHADRDALLGSLRLNIEPPWDSIDRWNSSIESTSRQSPAFGSRTSFIRSAVQTCRASWKPSNSRVVQAGERKATGASKTPV